MAITNFPQGVSSFGVPLYGGSPKPLTGNLYWVKKTTDTDWTRFYDERYAEYSDGTVSIYNTIQDAVTAAADGRGDMIVVCAGKWVEDVTIISKTGLRIFGQQNSAAGSTEAGFTRMRPNDATTKYSFTSKIGTTTNGASFHVLSRGVEIANFYFDGGGGCCGIYAGGGLNGGVTGYTTENASGLYIHDNFFRGGSEGQIGLYLNGVRFGALIERNTFERWTGAAIEMDAGNASNEVPIIRNNHFIADNAAYGIDIYGEGNSALGGQIIGNVFGDRVSHAFTMALNNRAGSTGVISVGNNVFACTNHMVLTTADWVSGNFKHTAGSATTGSNYFIQETADGA